MSSDAALKNEASFLLCVLKIKEILKVTPFITMEDIIYSYFIKNPVCIYDGSLDYHLYPLRVIFIRVTVVTLKTRQKHQFEFSQLLSLNILCIPCFFPPVFLSVQQRSKGSLVNSMASITCWCTSPVLWRDDNAAAQRGRATSCSIGAGIGRAAPASGSTRLRQKVTFLNLNCWLRVKKRTPGVKTVVSNWDYPHFY